ncbi:MAG TPA: hypothetical protein PKD26_14460 [Pyrinomonadaceae bacterium]|nr:hypothetical protein [Pyrinomonadaceae bacterium]
MQCPIIALDIHTTSPGQRKAVLVRDNGQSDGVPSVEPLNEMYQRALSIYRRGRNGRRRAAGVV